MPLWSLDGVAVFVANETFSRLFTDLYADELLTYAWSDFTPQLEWDEQA